VNDRYRPCVRFLGIVVFVDLLLLAAVGVTGWSLGWSTLFQYCDGAVLGGMLVAAVGTIGLLQERNPVRRSTHDYGEEGAGAETLERARHGKKDDAAGSWFFVHLLTAGLLAAMPAALIQATLAR